MSIRYSYVHYYEYTCVCLCVCAHAINKTTNKLFVFCFLNLIAFQTSRTQLDDQLYMMDKIRQLYPDNTDGGKRYWVGDRIGIYKKDLSTLLNPAEAPVKDSDKSGLLTAKIIDAYLIGLSRDYKHFSYLDTESVDYVQKDDVDADEAKEFLVDKLPKSGQTHYAIPFVVNKGHCILVAIRFDKKQYSILDPKAQRIQNMQKPPTTTTILDWQSDKV